MPVREALGLITDFPMKGRAMAPGVVACVERVEPLAGGHLR